MSLTEIIKKERPNLKDISIKQYIKSLNKLKDLFESDNYEFLKEPNEVMEKLSNLHFTTIRNTLNAVIVYLMAVDGDKDIIKTYPKWLWAGNIFCVALGLWVIFWL